QVYARQLLPRKLGYPLFVPESSTHLPAQFRERGISIGDVGVIKPNGSFNYIFSICASADDPVNYLGVPENFHQIDLNPNLISHLPNMHEKRSEVTSSSIKRVDVDFGGNLEQNAAILNLPDGAASTDYEALAPLRSYAIQNGVAWYNFINGELGLEAPNGSLYLVTGSDKATTWGLAAVSNGSLNSSVVLRFSAAM
ncbi:hypothetical protein FIBSPDRAFT_686005, partial [Athelia psychrophila]